MKSRQRQYIAYVVLATALLAAFQNCGPLMFLPLTSGPMQSSLYTDGVNNLQGLFKDSYVSVGPDSFTLYETAASPSSSVSVSIMPGAEAQLIPVSYTLYLVEAGGNLNPQTPLGTLTGTNTLNSSNGISSFSIVLNATKAQVTAAKNANATLVVEIKKSIPTETSWRLPVNIIPDMGVPPIDPPIDPPPPPVNEAELRRARCRTNTGIPSITAVSSSSVTNQYGQSNQGVEGNINGSPITLDYDRAILNQAAFNADSCVGLVTFRSMCSVVKGDVARPLSITNAISNGGEDRLAELRATIRAANPTFTDAQVSVAAQEAIADGAFTQNNGCNVQFTNGDVRGAISINPAYNNNNGFRCVQGSYWMRVVLRSQIDAQANKDSEPRYIQVTTNNGCWKEYRLKDVNNVNPRIPNVANLGSDVVINGNWAAGLAENENDEVNNINKVGALYLWKKENGNWVYKQKVKIPQSLANEAIQSVAIRGDYMVVGVPNKSAKAGAVYMFARGVDDVWSQVGNAFTAPDAAADQRFGRSIALCATKVYIGTPGARAVHAFDWDGAGIKSAGAVKIANNANNNFGQSVVCNANYVAVGAPGTGAQMGAASIYSTTGFTLFKTFTGTIPGEQFGYKVAMNGTRLAVSSDTYYTDATPELGRVSYFADFTTAATAPTRVFDGGNVSARLGSGIAFGPNGLYIGTPQNAGNVGVVTYHLYTELLNSGNAAYRIRAFNEAANSRFGFSINVDGSNIIIGARTQMIPGDNNGAAYIYEAK